MITIDEIMQRLGFERDQEAAEAFGRSAQAVSNWRRDGVVPAAIERMFNNRLSVAGTAKTVLQTNGDNHHIDITHVAEKREHYSPATNTLLDVIKDWPEKKRRKLLVDAITMNGDGEEEA